MLLRVVRLEGVVALALVFAVALTFLLLEQVVVAVGPFFFGRGHGRFVPEAPGYNPPRSPGAWRNW